jgi:hypothetical protein
MANRRTTLDSRYGKPVDYRKIKGLPILDDNGGGSAGPAGPKVIREILVQQARQVPACRLEVRLDRYHLKSVVLIMI